MLVLMAHQTPLPVSLILPPSIPKVTLQSQVLWLLGHLCSYSVVPVTVRMSSLNAQRKGTVRSIFVRVQSVLVAKALTSYAGKGYYWHDLYSVPAIHTDLLTPKMMPGATDKLSPETMSILLILASSRYHLISHAGSLSPTAREGGQALSVRTS